MSESASDEFERAVRRRRRVARRPRPPSLRPRRVRRAPRPGSRSTSRRRSSTRGGSSSTSPPCRTASTSPRAPPATEDKIGFSIASGAYFVETNGGGSSGTTGLVDRPDHRRVPGQRRRRAALARRSPRRCTASTAPTATPTAAAAAGTAPSGGAENTSGVWDGFVPYVIGSPMAIPNMFTVRMHAQRILRRPVRRDRRRRRAGWERRHVRGPRRRGARRARRGDPDGVPTPLVVRPPHHGHARLPRPLRRPAHGRPHLLRRLLDRARLPRPRRRRASLRRDVVQHPCEVVATDHRPRGGRARPRPSGRQPGQRRGGRRHVVAGQPTAAPAEPRRRPPLERARRSTSWAPTWSSRSGAAGRRPARSSSSSSSDVAVFGPGRPRGRWRSCEPGDAVEIDNRGFLAAQTYHRHQVPTPDFHVWDQFRNADGTPIYPQRPLLLGPAVRRRRGRARCRPAASRGR